MGKKFVEVGPHLIDLDKIDYTYHYESYRGSNTYKISMSSGITLFPSKNDYFEILRLFQKHMRTYQPKIVAGVAVINLDKIVSMIYVKNMNFEAVTLDFVNGQNSLQAMLSEYGNIKDALMSM